MQNYYFSIKNINTHLLLVIKLLNLQKIISYFLILLLYLMKTQKDLGFWKLWNLSFGFFGVQIAYALQSSQVSRIFSTIGADPHDLSYFWILPPLMGLIVQPLVGAASDRKIGRASCRERVLRLV